MKRISWRRALTVGGDGGRGLVLAVVMLAAVAGSAGRAFAHPHVWVDTIAQLMLDDRSHLKALRVYWAFDEIYTANILDEFHVSADEPIDPVKLTPVAAAVLNKAAAFRYFTHVKIDGVLAAQPAPQTVAGHYLNHRLVMYFTLPFDPPVDLHKSRLSFAIFDPSYYTAIDFAAKKPVRVDGTLPPDCAIEMSPPKEDPGDVVLPAESFFQHLDPSSAYGEQFARWVLVDCAATGAQQ